MEVVEARPSGPCRGDHHHDHHRSYPRRPRHRVFCWLLFTLAVYALPFSASLTAGLAAFHDGAGAIVVGIVAGVVTLGAGQFAFVVAGSPLTRAAIALPFATPAAVAGYHATLALAHIGASSQGWREAFAIIGAIFVGGPAWGRMTLLADPLRKR